MSKSSSPNARQIALQIVNRVLIDGEFSNLILPNTLAASRLDQRDRALATELTYGTLRRLGTLDSVIDQFVTGKLELPVRNALRIGAYQLLFMRVPSHAAVAETIDAAKKEIGHRTSGLLNAILRKISTNDWEQWQARLTPDLSPIARLAFIYSYPEWVITELSQAYQVEGDELIALLVAGNTAPQVDLVARPGQFSIAELLGLPEVEPGRWSPLAARLKSGAPSDLPAVRTGSVGVQDEGSQLVALALSEVVPTCEDSTWLDMCAGPGGKAALLAGLAVAQNFDFIALEPSAARAQLVEKSLAGLNSSRTSVVNIDAREYQTQATVTRILVDAPCTGLGALRRRPEARWRRTPSDVPTLAALQTQLLDHAADLIAAGGVIAYSTCSPVLAETDAIVDAFLATHPNFNPISVEQILPTIPNIAQRMRLRPDVHGTDGMFVALLHRIS